MNFWINVLMKCWRSFARNFREISKGIFGGNPEGNLWKSSKRDVWRSSGISLDFFPGISRGISGRILILILEIPK